MTPRINQFFLERHITDASAIIDDFSHEELWTFLLDLPFDLACNTINHLSATRCVSLLEKASDDQLKKFVPKIDFSKLNIIIHLANFRNRKRILFYVSQKKRLSLYSGLRFLPNTLGSRLKPCLQCNGDYNVEQVIKYIHESEDIPNRNTVFLVESVSNVLLGKVEAYQLLLADKTAKIKTLMSASGSFYTKTPLAVSTRSDLWSKQECIPVINKNRQVLGAVRFRDISPSRDFVNKVEKDEKQVNSSPFLDVFKEGSLDIIEAISYSMESKDK